MDFEMGKPDVSGAEKDVEVRLHSALAPFADAVAKGRKPQIALFNDLRHALLDVAVAAFEPATSTRFLKQLRAISMGQAKRRSTGESNRGAIPDWLSDRNSPYLIEEIAEILSVLVAGCRHDDAKAPEGSFFVGHLVAQYYYQQGQWEKLWLIQNAQRTTDASRLLQEARAAASAGFLFSFASYFHYRLAAKRRDRNPEAYPDNEHGEPDPDLFDAGGGDPSVAHEDDRTLYFDRLLAEMQGQCPRGERLSPGQARVLPLIYAGLSIQEIACRSLIDEQRSDYDHLVAIAASVDGVPERNALTWLLRVHSKRYESLQSVARAARRAGAGRLLLYALERQRGRSLNRWLRHMLLHGETARSVRDAAESFSTTRSRAKSTLHRARKRLLKWLQRRDAMPADLLLYAF